MTDISSILARTKSGYFDQPKQVQVVDESHRLPKHQDQASTDLQAAYERREAASDKGSSESVSGAGPAAPETAPALASSLPPDDDSTLTGMALVKRFITLDNIRDDIETIVEQAKERINLMRTRIAEWFAEQGMETVRVDGYTVYIRRQLWASYQTPDLDALPKDAQQATRQAAKQSLIEALKRAQWEVPDPDQPGMKRLISTAHLIHEDYNAQTLSALIRELPVDDQGDPIMPPALKNHVKVYYNITPCKRRTR